jgi:hypothetical protein
MSGEFKKVFFNQTGRDEKSLRKDTDFRTIDLETFLEVTSPTPLKCKMLLIIKTGKTVTSTLVIVFRSLR